MTSCCARFTKITRFTVSTPIAFFLALMLFAPSLKAQTVSFMGAQTPIATFPATTASGATNSLSYSMAVDAAGNSYVTNAVTDNSVTTNYVLKISPTGVITNLSSNFAFNASAIAVNTAGTKLYFIYYGDDTCVNFRHLAYATISGSTVSAPTEMSCKFTLPTTDEVPFSTGYTDPMDLKVDSSDNVYVGDFGSAAVYYIPSGSTTPSKWTYFQSTQLWDIAVSPDKSKIYITYDDYANNSHPTVGYIPSSALGTLGFGSTAPTRISASLTSIQTGLAVDSAGNVLVDGANAVYKATTTSYTAVTAISSQTLYGFGVDSSNNIYTETMDNTGNSYITATSYNSIGMGQVSVGSTSTAAAVNFQFTEGGTLGGVSALTLGSSAQEFLIDSSSTCSATTYSASATCTVYVKFAPAYAGLRRGAVVLTDSTGKPLATVYVYGSGSGAQQSYAPSTLTTIASSLSAPRAVAVDAAGNVFLADGNTVYKKTLSGGTYTQSTVASSLGSPAGLALDGAGNLYIADTSNGRVLLETLTGSTYTQSSLFTGLSSPTGIAVSGAGDIYISLAGGTVLKETLSNGGYVQSTVASGLSAASGVAVDDNQNVYIVDQGANKVYKEVPTSTSYTQSTVATGLNAPSGVAVDGAGNVYIADSGNNRVLIEKYSSGAYTASTLTDISSTVFNGPAGIALSGDGSLYLTQTGAKTLIKEDLAHPPTLSFASTKSQSSSTDSPRALTIYNIGNSSLYFVAPSSGNNPTIGADFVLGSSPTCPVLSSSSSSTALNAGTSCEYSISFTPAEATAVGAVSEALTLATNIAGSVSVPLTGTKLSPITLTPAAGALPNGVYGSAYSTSFATTNGTTPYTYTITSGSLPTGLTLDTTTGELQGTATAAGDSTFTVTVTDSATTPSTVAQAYTLKINAETPTLAITCAEVTYDGTAHGCTGSALGIGGATVTGTWTYSPATVAAAGATTITGVFTSTDPNYASGSTSSTLKINTATPTLTMTCTEATYDGTAHSCTGSAKGVGGATVAGTWAFSPATVTTASDTTVTGVFTSTDSNYVGGATSSSLKIDAAIPTLTLTCAEVTYDGAAHGCTGSAKGINGAAITGNWTYTPASMTNASSTAVTGSFVSSDTNYATGTATATLKINQAIPTITWATPASIIYGAALSATQLNATLSVPGQCVYSPASGTVLNAGTQVLTATCTPDDTTNYAIPATAQVSLNISKASQAITFAPIVSPVAYTSAIALSATGGNSGNPVTFSVVSGPAVVSGNLLTITGIGAIVLKADQAGNGNFLAAASVTQSILSVASSITSNAASLAFGSVPAGTTSAPQTLILGNSNGFALSNVLLSITGPFSQTSTCTTLAALSTCSVNVTFTPTGSATATGSLTITNTVSNSAISIPLTGTGTAPGLQITPAMVTFGSQVVGSTSYGQTISIQNTGTATLTISDINLAGDYAASGDCASVPANSSCNLTVKFTPTQIGTRAGTITLTDNAGNNNTSQTIQLTGTGTKAGALLTPSVQNFGGVLLGATSYQLLATLTNSGTADLTGIAVSTQGDFNQTTTCSTTLAAGASCTITVAYRPTLAGAESGLLVVSDNLGSQTVALTGTGLIPGATLNATQLTYGSQLITTSSQAQTVTFTNTGSGPVTINSVSITGDFTNTTNCSGTIASGSSCNINIVFAPATSGTQTGTLTINDSAGTQTVALQGRGISQGLSLSPATVFFGASQVGTSSPTQTLTLSNTGTVSLTLGSLVASSNFSASSQCGTTLAAGASCQISLSFVPTALGALSGTVQISDATGAVSATAVASGQGTLPGIAVTPSEFSFGGVPVGTSSQAQTVTVTNTGTAPLVIGTVSSTGDFAETDTCSNQTIAAGANCVISITVTPTTMGSRTGTVQFNDNADGMHQIMLSGIGQQPGVQISPSNLSFGSAPILSSSQVNVASGTTLSVTVANTGNVALQLSKIALQGDFTEADACGGTVAVGSTCTLSVTFTPTALGHRTGTLTISDNAHGGTQVITLEGDGSPAGLTLTPPSLNFGVQSVGKWSTTRVATLTNNTGVVLQDLVISASGEYAETNNCGSTMAIGASCTLNITVMPQLPGAVTGTINFYTSTALPSFGASTNLRSQSSIRVPSRMAITSSGSNIAVIALFTTTSSSTASASKLQFGSAPAAIVTAGGNAGSSLTVLETDSVGNIVSASDTITLAVTGPGGYTQNYSAAATGGVASFDLSASTLTAVGGYTYTTSANSASAITGTTANQTVNAGSATKVTALQGTNQNALIQAAFASPLKVQVTDKYANPISGATVSFNVPSSGAGAVLSSSTAITDSNGYAAVSATANKLAGSYTITATTGSATLANFTLTNSKGSSQVALSTNSSPALLQSLVTLTASLSAPQGVPTGTINFLDGTTVLGSGAINAAGIATYTTSALSVGLHNVTAVYAGDNNFSGSTSPVMVQSELDYTVTGAGTTLQTVVPGHSASYSFDLTPSSGASIPVAAVLSVTGLPSGASASLSGSSWTQLSATSWQLPANTAPGTPVLTIGTASVSSSTQNNSMIGKTAPMLLALLLLPFAGRIRRTGHRFGRLTLVVLAIMLGGLSMAGLSGCAAGNSYFSPQQKSYTVTVTVAAGSLSHTTNVTLTVE